MTVAEFYALHGDKDFFRYDRSGQSDYRYDGHYLYQVTYGKDDYPGYLVHIGDIGYQNDWIEPAKPDDEIVVLTND